VHAVLKSHTVFLHASKHQLIVHDHAQLFGLLLQARTNTMEAQLADTTTQLRELKLQQKQLEARNFLLEQVARMHQGPMPGTQAAHNPTGADFWQVRYSAYEWWGSYLLLLLLQQEFYLAVQNPDLMNAIVAVASNLISSTQAACVNCQETSPCSPY